MLRPHSLFLLVPFLLACTAGALNAQEKDPAAPQSIEAIQAAAAEQIEEALEKNLEVDFKETPLTEVATFFGKSLGAPVVLDHRALKDAGVDPRVAVTRRGKGITARSVLRLILQEFDLTYTIQNESLVITSPDSNCPAMLTRIYNVSHLVDLADDQNGLHYDHDSLIELLTTTTQPAMWDDVGGAGTIAPLHGTLIISQTLDAHEEIEELLTALSTARSAVRHGKSLPISLPIRASSEKIEAALAKPIELDLTEVPLSKLVNQLRAQSGIEVQLHRRALQDAGVELQTPVSLQVQDITLQSAINHVLKQLDLTTIIRDEVLLITSPDEANVHLEARVYPVADLLTTSASAPNTPAPPAKESEEQTSRLQRLPRNILAQLGGGAGAGMYMHSPRFVRLHDPQQMEADYDSLIEAITTTIAPSSWDDVGGPGPISPHEPASSLVISQTRDVHQQIERLLVELRKVRNQKVAAAPEESDRSSEPVVMLYHVPAKTAGTNAASAQELVALVQALIEPKSWEDDSNFIGAVTGAVVVQNSSAVQQQVRQLLLQLELLNATNAEGGGFGGGFQ